MKSVIITLSILVFIIIANFFSLNFFEPKAYNYMVKHFSADKSGSSAIAIIAIDDQSISRIRWPWKRELYAKIFKYLDEYSTCSVIGFDGAISTPDKDSPESDKKFYDSIKDINKLVVGFATLKQPYADKQAGENYDREFKKKFSILVNDQRNIKKESKAQSISRFPLDYFASATKVGSITITPDSDGYFRDSDQLIDYKGTLYPSLAMRMYSYLHGNTSFSAHETYISAEGTSLKIPTLSQNGTIYNKLHFYKTEPKSEYTHQTYSAIDIIDSYDAMKRGQLPKISPQVFEDKMVFVGANAKALALGLEDVKRTPILNSHAGVDIQATNLDNLINNEFITPLNFVQNLALLISILGLTFVFVRFFSITTSIFAVAALMIGYYIFCIICYKFDYAPTVITPIALQIIVMAVAYSYRFYLEGQNKERIKKAMGKYISEDVMHDVVKNITDVKLGGKKATLTVLFADIRGFTSMSEKMSAEEVSIILNEYFTALEPIISKYNGVINKFIGDAVMAIFGEPIQDKDHATNAVKCANEMLLKVDELQKKWVQEGKPKLEIGIGINTGEAFVGNIGSEKRLEYTVIGDMVNLASRIESFNKVYKTKFLISASTYQQVRDLADVIKISEVAIRGKAQKTNIYEVLRLI